jgi:hypothetical protein
MRRLRDQEPPPTPDPEIGNLLPPAVFPATSPAYLLLLHNGSDEIIIEHLPVIAWASQTRAVEAPTNWFTGLYPITPGFSGIPTQYVSLSCQIDWCVLHGLLHAEAVLEVSRELVSGALSQLCHEAETIDVHYVVADDLEDTTPSGVFTGSGEWRGTDPEQVAAFAKTADRLVTMIRESEDWTIETIPLTRSLRAELML